MEKVGLPKPKPLPSTVVTGAFGRQVLENDLSHRWITLQEGEEYTVPAASDVAVRCWSMWRAVYLHDETVLRGPLLFTAPEPGDGRLTHFERDAPFVGALLSALFLGALPCFVLLPSSEAGLAGFLIATLVASLPGALAGLLVGRHRDRKEAQRNRSGTVETRRILFRGAF